MKYIKNRETFNELRVFGKTKDLEGKYILLIRGNLYILDSEKSEISDIFEKEKLTGGSYDNIKILSDLYKTGIPFIFIGQIKNNVLKSLGHQYWDFIYYTGSDVDKIIKQLKLDGYETSHEGTEKANDIWYHGTTFSKALNIFNKGLLPRSISKEVSNHRNVKHDEVIFLSQNLYVASLHADKQSMDNWDYNDIPVIIQCRIPDQSKVIPDFDLSGEFYGDDLIKHYGEMDFYHHNPKAGIYRKYSDRKNLEKKFGVIGYKGRIPLTFIEKSVLIPTQPFLDEYIQSSIEYQNLGEVETEFDIGEISLADFVNILEEKDFNELKNYINDKK